MTPAERGTQRTTSSASACPMSMPPWRRLMSICGQSAIPPLAGRRHDHRCCWNRRFWVVAVAGPGRVARGIALISGQPGRVTMVPAAAYDERADWYEHEFLAGPAAPGTDPLGIDAALGALLGRGPGVCLEI